MARVGATKAMTTPRFRNPIIINSDIFWGDLTPGGPAKISHGRSSRKRSFTPESGRSGYYDGAAAAMGRMHPPTSEYECDGDDK
jgi:hypothetical protein